MREKVFVKNERMYQSCVRSAMLHGSAAWSLRENGMGILRTENAMCGVKLIAKRSQKLISLLGLKDTLEGLARASGVRWYGREEG